MALRTILTSEEQSLYKKCREVTKFDARLHQLLDDMTETLEKSGGVGLAAPQVGILRRAVIVLETNVDNEEDEYFIELINPEIVETEGEQTGAEGCLSVPEQYGVVTRPEHVKVRAQDRNGEVFEIEGDGLTARCFCHEIDHLEGILFTSKCERMLTEEEKAEMLAQGEDGEKEEAKEKK